MKEFEKWIRGHNSIPAFPRYTTTEEDNAAKEAWRAALEWASEQEDWIGPDEGGSWGIDKYEIEEELGNE